jgi:hypothetical protein
MNIKFHFSYDKRKIVLSLNKMLIKFTLKKDKINHLFQF